MAKMKGADALTQSIKQYGVDTIFTVPGVQLDNLYDVLYDHQDDIRIIHTRHEQATAYMAYGYARSTGKVGTNLIVPGPGLMNAGAGLLTAHACNTPVLCIAGQIPSQAIDKGIGLLHELEDQPGAVAGATKWNGRANTPSETPGVIRDAFIQLNTGRRQPVLFEMAPDTMSSVEDVDLLDPVTDFSEFEVEPDLDLLEQAAALLGNAENPAIFTGGGVFGAEEALLALAEEIQAPVIMSQNGNGAVDQRHYLGQNQMVGLELWKDIDVVLAVGTKFLAPMNMWRKQGEKKLIRIDTDPRPNDPWQPDIQIIAPANKSLAGLYDRAVRHNRKRESREDELNVLKAAATKKINQGRPQADFGQVIRSVLPDDGIVCFGVTQMGFYSWFGFPTYHPAGNIQPGYQGTLGYSFPTGLGAQVGNPDKKVVTVTGDGGFMFNVQELATAVLHKIPLVTILFNDNAFGNVKRNQKTDYNERYIACDLLNPDFMKLAESFGLMGLRVDSPEGLQEAMEKAFAEDGPVLIEIEVGPMESLWQYMPLKRAKDDEK
ncbi:MAG: thiamine pyrophosphate-binding protein [Rhodospirillales bacterium]|nr:thiamine pyrophosphate-binding protein [Rhodospirillales bacterium]